MIREIDLDKWKLMHPRASKNYPEFFVDFNLRGSTWKDIGVRYSWTAIRQLVLERDGQACRVCNDKEDKIDEWYKAEYWKGGYRSNCEVQHIIPKKDGGTNHPSNLITLCRKCHVSTFKRGYSGIPSITSENQYSLITYSKSTKPEKVDG